MATRTRTRGYAKWRPESFTQRIIKQVKEILEEYREYWPLTVRQIFYRLVGAYGYEKTEEACESLGEYLNRARREYRDKPWSIPWEAIRDDGVATESYSGYHNAKDFMRSAQQAAASFTLDLMSRQAVHIEILCEAGGMLPQVASVAHSYGVTVSSGGGFNSTTDKHASALRWSQIGKPVKLLHIGDMDPSGVHIHKAFDEDVTKFMHFYGGDFELVRLAVVPAQIEKYELPLGYKKVTDNREYPYDFTVQAEALSPPQLAEIVRTGIERFTDLDVLAKSRRGEKQIRGRLVRRMGNA